MTSNNRSRTVRVAAYAVLTLAFVALSGYGGCFIDTPDIVVDTAPPPPPPPVEYAPP